MRKPYPSDLTDEQWEIIQPLIPVNTVGRPRTVEMREVLNAIFYLNRSGCQWDMLPHDLPPRSTVHDYYHQWRCDGTWQEIMDALRRMVRVAVGKERHEDQAEGSGFRHDGGRAGRTRRSRRLGWTDRAGRGRGVTVREDCRN